MVLGFGHRHQDSSDEPRGRPIGTGRGGAGNILAHSHKSADAEVEQHEEKARAAQQYAAEHPAGGVASGRGGVGNVRSASRDPADRARLQEEELHEAELREEYRQKEDFHPHGGRGGLGNVHHEERGRTASTERGRREGPVEHILRSISRSRSRDTRARESGQHANERAPAGNSLANVTESNE